MNGYRVRPLGAAALEQAHALSREAGWPHRVEDWAFVLALAKDFGVYRSNGDLVATAMWWPLGDGFAATGMIIVAQAMRRQGLARELLRRILSRTAERAVTLNATQDGYRLYESVGFRATRHIHQHQGLPSLDQIPSAPSTGTIRPRSSTDAELILSLDRAATGLDRRAVLRALHPLTEGIVLERQDRPVGFSLIRPFGRGLVIGPVVAPDDEGAKALIGYWLARRAGQFVRVDIPEDGGTLGTWLAQAGLARVDVVTTMWRGVPPQTDSTARVFGLVNQALG